MVANRMPSAYTFTRYLAAKRTVDDRALNQRLWQTMVRELAALPPTPVNVLEVGGGIGTMVERLLAEPNLPLLTYHMLDAEPENIATAAARLCRQPALPTTEQHPLGITPSHHFHVEDTRNQEQRLYLYGQDLFDFLAALPILEQIQLVIANAFLDLVDLPSTLARFAVAFSPCTLLYFTINFDGATIFQPTIDPAFDAHIEAVYHRTMDERITAGEPSGDSHTGRHLFHTMQQAGIEVLDAGSSDWYVFPHDGRYPHDEAYFLHFILHTMHNALAAHPDIDRDRFNRWIDQRHRQVEDGEMTYIAHQLDYLARISANLDTDSW